MARYFVSFVLDKAFGVDLLAGRHRFGTSRAKIASGRQISRAGDLALENHSFAAVAGVFDGYGA